MYNRKSCRTYCHKWPDIRRLQWPKNRSGYWWWTV